MFGSVLVSAPFMEIMWSCLVRRALTGDVGL